MNEIWKSCNGYDGYEVSNFGNVRTFWAGGGNKRFISPTNFKLMKISMYPNGYAFIRIARQNVYLHRLVAEAFLDNPYNLRCVDHIDRNRANNHINNLRWCSHRQNSYNAKIRTDNKSGISGICFHNGKWEAQISINGMKHIDRFTTIEDAIEYRNRMVEEHYDGNFYTKNNNTLL